MFTIIIAFFLAVTIFHVWNIAEGVETLNKYSPEAKVSGFSRAVHKTIYLMKK